MTTLPAFQQDARRVNQLALETCALTGDERPRREMVSAFAQEITWHADVQQECQAVASGALRWGVVDPGCWAARDPETGEVYVIDERSR